MIRSLLALFVFVSVLPNNAPAQSIQTDVAPFIDATCMKCHNAETETPLDMTKLGHDLADRDTFKTWVRIYERAKNREMPPSSEPRPKRAELEHMLASLKGTLVDANLAARGPQRTPLRRLTRLEYAYTIEDLLSVDEEIASELSKLLPAEADSGGFNTVSVHQSMSSLHVRSYLKAADEALDAALKIGPAPTSKWQKIDYAKSSRLRSMSNLKNLGLSVVKEVEDAYVTFIESSATFNFHSINEGYQVPTPGRYHVAFKAYPYQATSTVGLAVYKGKMGGVAASLDNLIGTFDLEQDAPPQTYELTPFLRPGDLVSPLAFDLKRIGNPDKDNDINNGYELIDYKGEGIALQSLTIEGPLYDMWPPASTRETLVGVEFTDDGEIQLTKDPYEHITDIVASFATRAFRRPLEDGEVEAYASLAKPLLDDGRPFIEALRVSLRAILIAPAFIYQSSEAEMPSDYALATRMSYFLWRSMPDAELFAAAQNGRLRETDTLRDQIDRMLDDPKNERFVKDFAGQAFRLYELKATAPDGKLYPEYNDFLGKAMGEETELFIAELISENLGVGQLIDSDFTFLNRELAEHYDIPGVLGQQMRKVAIPEDSPRGGLLTQASILKITANGTSTSPIPRGNFVLTNLLGQPAPPPPPGVAALEPDIRGTTTIREQLDAHRVDPVCASCHNTIDPPGFALEAFDPVGSFRENYRKFVGEDRSNGYPPRSRFEDGPEVDASGVTPEGYPFEGIEEYKQLLLKNEIDQVARNIASKLLVFSTGAEIEFVDREAVEQIVKQGRDLGHPIRNMIHEVVLSDLFRRS